MKRFVPFFIAFTLVAFVTVEKNAKENKTEKKIRKRFLKQRPHLSYIPEGKYFTENDSLEMKSFFISKYECSNIEYLEFYHDMFRKDSIYAKAKLQLQNSRWQEGLTYGEPYEKYYATHPAYKNYPLVNVSYKQAKAFCQWLTERYNAHPDRAYKEVLVRLPSKSEWEYAAKGGLTLSPYPWGGPFVRNSQGDMLANFVRIPDGNIARNDSGEMYINREDWIPNAEFFKNLKYSGVTTPCKSYWPNGYDLYCMAGNVAEFVEEEGVCKGGNWRDPGCYLRINVDQNYDQGESAAPNRGFRYLLEIVEE
jgi:formylglycine-generating enzyme required for sulfatase activity